MTAGSAASSTKSINVTPLIDILLVLLIIFLVLMPTMLRQETVALPPHEDVGPPEPPIVLVLHADLTVSVDGGAQVPVTAIPSVLAPQLKKPRTVFVDADAGVAWSEVVGLVDHVRGIAGSDRPDAVAFQIHVSSPE